MADLASSSSALWVLRAASPVCHWDIDGRRTDGQACGAVLLMELLRGSGDAFCILDLFVFDFVFDFVFVRCLGNLGLR